MRYIIMDLEATCDREGFPPERMETIEIGAVCLEAAAGPVGDSFEAFLRPIATQTLTAFCTELTGITQSDVENAEPFYTVFPRFVQWCEAPGTPFTLCSWGAYDLKQLQRDCERHRMPFPPTLLQHINIKAEFSRQRGLRPMGMMGALAHERIAATGRHHRGIDDARNIARIAEAVLPRWEQEHAE